MNAAQLISWLDQLLPDAQIGQDILGLLRQNASEKELTIELGKKKVRVPTEARLEVVTKALFKDSHETGFGTVKAQAAIGEIVSLANGVIVPQYCFATLYYNENCELITADFHSDFR